MGSGTISSTTPRTSTKRYGLSGSQINIATCGFAVTLRYFCRLVVWVNRSNSPSQSNHIGFTCRLPSGLVVARCPYSGRSNSDSYPLGISTITILSRFGGDPLPLTTCSSAIPILGRYRRPSAMTVDTRARPAYTWTPLVTVQLTMLAAAAFVYVTAEMVPVGALPAIAADLRVSEALVGTLLASYALVAAVTTVPAVR